MKAFYSIVGVLFFMTTNAQKFDCSSKIKEYQDLIQAKKISESYDSWNEVRKNCPKENETIYSDGVTILEYKIDNESSLEEKEKLVREELKLYDQFNKNFPLTIPDFEVQKAMTLYNHKIGTKDEILGLLDSGFAKASKNITSANTIYTYFNLYFEKYKEENSKITVDKALGKYMQVNELLENLIASMPEKNNEYKTAQRGIRALAKELTSCDRLSGYYEKQFENNKNDISWLNSALSNFTLKCSGLPIYNTMAEANYKLKATSKSAFYLANAYVKQRKFTEAIQYFTEAETLETDPIEKAKLNYSLATGLLSNDKVKSKELLNKTLSLNPKMGRAYLFLGELYANSAEECGQTDFQKKAVYYLAIETMKKAVAAEPILKTTVQKMSDNLASKSLTSAEISNAKMNGKSIKIECWINETIVFPTK
jgi:tetratricopeptide (TPR) repeat protein